MSYLHWNEQTITDFSPKNIEAMYNQGYVFTRLGKGVMHQTRSARIDLSKFELSSENRRILKKVENLALESLSLPLPLSSEADSLELKAKSYSWEIGKMGKDFYESRSADFSANKIKELITDSAKSNFNVLLNFTLRSTLDVRRSVGYVIAFQTDSIFHYSYPFYDLDVPKDTGLGMMLLAIEWAKNAGKKYFYLGSLQRPNDGYKLQFAGIEWFDNERGQWNKDIGKAKFILNP